MWKGDNMPLCSDLEQLKRIETMLLKEMDRDGRIMVRSLDKIHARTGLQYSTISEIARRLQEQGLRSLTAS
jgi:DNA-binding Lrp family transcriptional regulator